MAQLVLAAAGAAIGGAVLGPGAVVFGLTGSQLGWMAGAVIGSALAPKQRIEGPSLADLRVTGTDYGSPIAWCAGAPRIPGDLAWASDRRKIVSTEEFGKGGGGTQVTTNTYEVDLLYLLADQVGATVTRVFENGKLVWTNLESADDQSRIASEQTPRWRRITIYHGGEGQLPDPTYDAAVDNAPAYRRRLTVFIEGMQLGASGALSNLTFEVATAFSPSAELSRRHAVTDNVYLSEPAILAMQPAVRVGVVGGDSVYLFGLDGAESGITTRTLDEPYPSRKGNDSLGTTTSFPVGILSGLPVRCANHFYSIGTPSKLHICVGIQNAIDWGAGGIAPDLATALPSGRYLGDTIPCSDGTHLLAFTAPTSAYFGGAVLDRWHILRLDDSIPVLVSEGSIAVPTTWRCYGNVGQFNYSFRAGMLEDDLEHVWMCNAAGTGDVDMFRIDPTDGVLRLRGTAAQGLPAHAFNYPSIWAEGGYAVAVSGASFGAWRRGGDTIEEVPLQTVVESICARSGMPASAYDASALAAISRPVRALAVAGGAARQALEYLQTSHAFSAYQADKIYFVPRGGAAAATVSAADLAAGEDAPAEEAFPIAVNADLEIPSRVAVVYRDMSADQQSGTEYSDRGPSGQDSVQTLQLPIGMLPSEAKGAADAAVRDVFAGRLTSTISLPIGYAAIVPTDVLLVPDRDGALIRMRVNRRTESAGVLALELVGDDAGVAVLDLPTDATAQTSTAVQAIADTRFEVLDMPLQNDADDAPGVYVCARSAGGGVWTGCALLLSRDGLNFSAAGSINEPGVIGSATTVLGDWSGGWVMDEVNTVTVDVGEDTLSSVARGDLLADASLNALLLGDEVIRYATATLLSVAPNIYRLSRLLRGQRGTEWATGTHATGERAIVLQARGMRRVSLQASDIGKGIWLKAVTSGNSAARATATLFTLIDSGQVPLAPVDIRLARTTADDIEISWKRRTRLETRFCGPSGIYVPLGESSESYAVQIMSGDAVVRTITCGEQKAIYTRIQARADHGAVPDTLTVQVRQISSTVGYGRAGGATLQVPASIAGDPASPGGPLPDPPTVPLRTAVPTHLVCETAAGVLAMREEAGAPVYYVSSGASMVPLGMASSAFMSKGNRNRVIEYAGTVWYFASIPSNWREIYAITVPSDYSEAPTLQGSAVGWLVSAAHTSAPIIIGADAERVVAWNDSNEVFVATTMPTFTYVGVAQPDASVGWSSPYSYFQVFSSLRAPLMLRTSAGWILAASGYTQGLWVYRTTDANAQANWINCAAVSAQPGMDYEIYRQSEFYDAIAIGSRVYLSGKWLGLSFLAISSDSGVTWTKYSTGLRAYWHLMKIGSVVVAISGDGKWCAINSGPGAAWAEREMVGFGAPPYLDITKPRGEFFIDRSESYDSGGYLAYDKDVIMHTSDGIAWTSVA